MTSSITNKFKLGALALGATIAAAILTGPAATTARAQDSGALLNVLVKKHILTDQEAEDLRAETAKESAASVVETVSAGKSTTGLQFSGRLQMQYVNVITTADTQTPGNATYNRVSQMFLRRLYFGARANLGGNWAADFNYDFADTGSWDRAFINWTGKIPALANAPFSFDIGLRKVNFAYDEFTSSGSLKAIERSAANRYFAEDANGRRLGTASYHIGLFGTYKPLAFAGKTTGFFAGAAVTNPQRQSANSEVSQTFNNSTTNMVNKPAGWLNAGYSGKSGTVTYLLGAAAAYLPQMGGTGRASNPTANPGQNILQYNAYVDITAGKFNIVAEYLGAQVDKGVAAYGTTPAANATVSAFNIMPSYKITDKWEIVARYSRTDTGGHGIRLGDGVRSATNAFDSKNANVLDEYYLGANYYIIGNDLKLQFGYIGGRTSGALPGATAPLNKETANGFRTQLQVNF